MVQGLVLYRGNTMLQYLLIIYKLLTKWPSEDSFSFFFFFFLRGLDVSIDVGIRVGIELLVESSTVGPARTTVAAVGLLLLDLRFLPTNFASVRARFSPCCFRVEVQIDVVEPHSVHVYTISVAGAT
jgi:hypothetical protein